jgi:hypothetical protein
MVSKVVYSGKKQKKCGTKSTIFLLIFEIYPAITQNYNGIKIVNMALML